ncbi:MAG: acylphosphatase [Acidimicrobiia bacterium]|nr:acylphosphatase [Acidimicrobiia bacterium]
MRVLVRIRGRVQGVFFRDSTRREALTHGVCGWVRNLPDGSVEVALEGRRDAVDAVLAFCEVGPPRAFVAGVEISETEPLGEEGFRIV